MKRRHLLLGAVAAVGMQRGAAGGDAEEQSLGTAVAAFNEAARRNPVGNEQPPLTEEEVIASIRGWIRSQVQASDEVYAAFQQIAATGKLPKGAQLEFTTGWRGYRGFDFDVWWIDLSISTGPMSGYTYRIRDRKLRSRPSQQ